jgi:NAD(P)-dependent dehydrogenase (short-subunit alcohol dehydrogenase family)
MDMNKTILITGASSGIGKVTAQYFQDQDWNVIATMRTPSDGRELEALQNVAVVELDVLKVDSIGFAINRGIERFGGIDVLLNNAGYGASGPLEATTIEKIRRQFDTNVIGLLEVTKAVLPHFRATKHGMVINVSSPAGRSGFPFSSLYCGSKFAVEGISEALWFELAAIGISVKIVTPGRMATDFSDRSFDFNNDVELNEYQGLVEKFSEARNKFPAGGSPQLVAEVIYQAATDGSSQLRYFAGEDAEKLISMRSSLGDAVFLQSIRTQFGF